VFAHPRARSRGRIVGDDTIATLAEAGLGGLEVDHLDHGSDDRDELRALAKDLGLVATGSSDFHGSNKTIPLGANTTSVESYEALVAQATSDVHPLSG
jgi:hypothetical protein